jgi:peptidoglycan/LPS O-acetylase OafA/YrhL
LWIAFMHDATSYRADIDGLRAVAIIPVVLFHAGIPGLSGGFVGVDVFFVISGFLITSLVMHQPTEQFSLAAFYERRVRRLFPALFTMLAACIGASLILLPPDELAVFARSLISTVAFGANFFFWSQTGYFDAPAEAHPLLHMWSLAIEEQFYFVFPALLIWLRRHRTAWIGPALKAALVASLALQIWLTFNAGAAAFYLSPARCWELLLGSAIALRPGLPAHPSRASTDAMGWLGLSLILGTVVAWPAGYHPTLATILPCVGAGLLIQAGRSGPTFVSRLLATAPMVWFGRLSYSLYLWHWPVLVFAQVHFEGPLQPEVAALALITSVFLAWASHTLVEQPFRRPRAIFGRTGVFASAAGVVTVMATIGALAAKEGFPRRFNSQLALSDPQEARPGCLLKSSDRLEAWSDVRCRVQASKADAAKPPVLLWGDSFAAHYTPAFETKASELPASILQFTMETCAPVLDTTLNNSFCADFTKHVHTVIERHRIKHVILAANWGHQRIDALVETVAWLHGSGITVTVIGQSPHFKQSVPRMYWWAMRDGKLVKSHHPAAEVGHTINQAIKNRLDPRAMFIDPSGALCRANECAIGEGLHPYFSDAVHLTASGSSRALKTEWPLLLPHLAR